MIGVVSECTVCPSTFDNHNDKIVKCVHYDGLIWYVWDCGRGDLFVACGPHTKPHDPLVCGKTHMSFVTAQETLTYLDQLVEAYEP